jgi:hypothetical protein
MGRKKPLHSTYRTRKKFNNKLNKGRICRMNSKNNLLSILANRNITVRRKIILEEVALK